MRAKPTDAATLLEDMRRAGYNVRLDPATGRLIMSGPAGGMTNVFAARAKAIKPELVGMLTAPTTKQAPGRAASAPVQAAGWLGEEVSGSEWDSKPTLPGAEAKSGWELAQADRQRRVAEAWEDWAKRHDANNT